MAVLILSYLDDPHLPLVTNSLKALEVPFIVYCQNQFPAKSQITLTYSTRGEVQQSLHILGEQNVTLDLDEISAVWDRRPKLPQADSQISDPVLREYIEKTSEDFLDDTWHLLACLWIPGLPSVVSRARNKGTQLKLAGQLGLEIPPTLITNNPEEFLEFYRRHNGRIISKSFLPQPLVEGGFNSGGYCWGITTQPVTGADVGFASSIRFCPVIFQAYIPKHIELRITVVGEEIFPCEIHSQSGHRTKYDWRNYDETNTPYYPHELPSDIREQCLQLVKSLGLCYGAIDMILTPDGRYVFLEINPKGQFGWIEDNTGLSISSAIANLLVSREHQNFKLGAKVS